MSNKSNATIATMGIDIGKNSFHVVGLPTPFSMDDQSEPQVSARLQSGLTAALFDHCGKVLPPKILRPPERRRIVFVVPDVGVGTRVE